MTTSTQPTATARLVKDLRGLALELERDLAVRASERPFADRLRGDYDEARGLERTAAGYGEWVAGRVTQAAAAWVLATVFVRHCEDNDLIDRPFLSGPGERLTLAEEYQNQYFADLPTLNNRDYLVAAFTHIAEAHPAAAGLSTRRRTRRTRCGTSRRPTRPRTG